MFIKITEKFKKYDYLVLRLMLKGKQDKMNSSVRENIIHYNLSIILIIYYFFLMLKTWDLV